MERLRNSVLSIRKRWSRCCQVMILKETGEEGLEETCNYDMM